MRRIDTITPTSKQSEYYSDLLINLDRNPISGEIARVMNERSIVKSIKNLLLTNKGERPFNSSIGSDIKKILFEPMDDVTVDLLRESIQTTIAQHEPRAELKLIDIVPNEVNNSYQVSITFSIVNSPNELFSFTTVLKRIR